MFETFDHYLFCTGQYSWFCFILNLLSLSHTHTHAHTHTHTHTHTVRFNRCKFSNLVKLVDNSKTDGFSRFRGTII